MTVLPVHRFALIALLTCTGATSCSPSNGERPDADLRDDTDSTTPTVAQHCFRNEYPFADAPGNPDVLELSVLILGDSASGTYRWLPALKDRRVGTLQGAVHDSAIEATYSFLQEGLAQSAQVTITLGESGATVRGGSPALGLDADIGRVACSG